MAARSHLHPPDPGSCDDSGPAQAARCRPDPSLPHSHRCRQGPRAEYPRHLCCPDRARSCGGVRFRSLRRLIRRSEELNVFDLTDFRSILSRNRGHRGAAPLSRALAIYESPRFTRSEFEREFAALAEQMELPAFATNLNAAGYELDVYWPELRFGVELDVYATHGAVEPFEEDRRRDEDLKLAGVELTRVTAYRFEREPRKVMERVGRLLTQRREQIGAGAW